MQAYENKTLRILAKTIDDEPVCFFDKILRFSNYNVREYTISYKNSRHT
jgi:hypothetical protein